MTNADRFRLLVSTHSDNTYGWNGALLDKMTGTRFPLLKTVVDYEVDGEVGYATCAFDTREELLAAAKRKARKLLARH